MRNAIPLVTVTILLVSVGSAADPSSSQTARDPTGEIYQLVLRRYVTTSQVAPKRFVVRATVRDAWLDSTSSVESQIRGVLGDSEADLIRNFVGTLRDGGPPARLDEVDPPVTVVTDGELDARVGRPWFDHWSRFQEAYPGAAGITTLSPVGYSSDGRKAMVYIATSREGLNAEGHVVVLVHNDTWTISTAFQVWQA